MDKNKSSRIVIISGEGDCGVIELYTGKECDLKKALKKARCGGDRWARAYKYSHETAGCSTYANVENPEDMRTIPGKAIKGLEE